MNHRIFRVAFFICLIPGFLQAQPPSYTPHQGRVYVHYKLDEAQKKLLAVDGKADEELHGSNNDDINLLLTYTATLKVDALQKSIELDTVLNNTQKLTYLRGLGELIENYILAYKIRQVRLLQWPDAEKAWEEAYRLDRRGLSIAPVMLNFPNAVGTIIVKGISFSENTGLAAAKDNLVLKLLQERPNSLMQILANNPNSPFADSLVVVAVKTKPEELYKYAQASNSSLGRRIYSNSDPAVKLMCTLANDNAGRLYFPFLDNLMKGKMTKESIAKVMNDSIAYYSLLVKTEIEYAKRAADGDTAVVWNALADMLHRKAVDVYVNPINELHEATDPVRFKKISNLPPQELYYLAVMCENEIYTSSYVRGVYKYLWQRMAVPNADSLLALVASDRYKKFITIAANYNTLDDFLGKMKPQNATDLMVSFVNNLEKGRDEDDIEDAVDVANAYASIKKPDLKKLMLEHVSSNYDHAALMNSAKGKVIYRIEKLVMQSEDSTAHIDISDSLGILPIYGAKNSFLKDSLGRIVMQMFFYGDKSGMGNFNSYVGGFSPKQWKMESKKWWVQLTSINTVVPIILFANRPLDENQNLDEAAQDSLNAYMDKAGYQPSITVHRGHSYYLPTTIKKLNPSSKLVILGSCGAYQNLRDILTTCPESYIISSKQTGYGTINNALIQYTFDNLQKGYDLSWPQMQTEVNKMIRIKTPDLQKREGFDDYIFPHKNLGAIFIKAYKKAMETSQ